MSLFPTTKHSHKGYVNTTAATGLFQLCSTHSTGALQTQKYPGDTSQACWRAKSWEQPERDTLAHLYWHTSRLRACVQAQVGGTYSESTEPRQAATIMVTWPVCWPFVCLLPYPWFIFCIHSILVQLPGIFISFLSWYSKFKYTFSVKSASAGFELLHLAYLTLTKPFIII